MVIPLMATVRDRIYHKVIYPGWQKDYPSKTERIEEILDLGLRAEEKIKEAKKAEEDKQNE